MTKSSAASTLAGPSTQFYTWKGYRCAYEVHESPDQKQNATPILLIHPIGVGLSRRFWDRFCAAWFASGNPNPIYNPDLLGCGESDMPHVAYTPQDWAKQLQYFLETVVQEPAIVIAQGALFPVAIALAQLQNESSWVKGLVLSGPPAWPVMTNETPDWQTKLSWSLFDSPLGRGFYRYARRRQFLESFSNKQLFARSEDVDQQWLDMLQAGAEDTASRHAVYSFLAGFWRKDYEQAIAHLNPPTLVVLGNEASSISRSGKSETPEQRMNDYLNHLPHGEGVQISGRNVPPYESTQAFVEAIAPFIQRLTHS